MKLLSTRKTVFIVLSVVLSSFALGAFGESKVHRDRNDIYHDLEVFATILEKVQSYYQILLMAKTNALYYNFLVISGTS